MITAAGRSAVEEEIEQMQFTGLERRQLIYGLDYADDKVYQPEQLPETAPSPFLRWIERLFGLSELEPR
jgi:hypothetical protein